MIVLALCSLQAVACDKAVVVDTWVQDEGKSTGKVVVKQFCPLVGAAAVPVVDAKPKVVGLQRLPINPKDDAVLIYNEGNKLIEVQIYIKEYK